MEVLPAEYHYEFYTSRFGEPFFACKTSNPLMTITKGDYLDHRGFPGFPLKVAKDARVKIAEIEHIIWEIEGDHIGHKLMCVIEITTESD